MLNVVAIMGRLVADPELRTTPQGTNVCSYLEAFTPETTQKGLCDLAASAKRLSDMFEAL